jgi:hypothetical protein
MLRKDTQNGTNHSSVSWGGGGSRPHLGLSTAFVSRNQEIIHIVQSVSKATEMSSSRGAPNSHHLLVPHPQYRYSTKSGVSWDTVAFCSPSCPLAERQLILSLAMQQRQPSDARSFGQTRNRIDLLGINDLRSHGKETALCWSSRGKLANVFSLGTIFL